MSLPFWARVVGDSSNKNRDTSDVVGHGLDADLRFGLTSGGRLADSTIRVYTASPEINASLEAAVLRADSAMAFPSARGPGRAVVLRLIDWTKRRGPAVGLVEITVPTIKADSFAELASIPSIMYPLGPRQGGISSSVTLQFVITERGAVDPTAPMQIVEAEYREFVVAAARAIDRATFVPARISGCAVPTQVRMPIDFRIRR